MYSHELAVAFFPQIRESESRPSRRKQSRGRFVSGLQSRSPVREPTVSVIEQASMSALIPYFDQVLFDSFFDETTGSGGLRTPLIEERRSTTPRKGGMVGGAEQQRRDPFLEDGETGPLGPGDDQR